MKIKRASIFSLVLAVALIVGVTTAFATSAISVAADKIGDIPFEQNATTHDESALARANVNAVPPSVSGEQSKNETAIPEKYMDIDGALGYEYGEEPEDLSATVNIANTTLLSVRHDDERKYTSEEWSHILDLISEGKVFWED